MFELTTLMWIVFFFGYALIALAETIHINKAATSLAMGGSLMFMAATRPGAHFAEEITHMGSETMGVVGFLLCAMTLVEILVDFQFFDWVRFRLLKLGLGKRGQYFAISICTFFFSSALDNLTTTIVMLRIAALFFRGKSLFFTACAIISAANSGGAWSPIGDVTTFMLWAAKKFTTLELIQTTFLPSLASFTVVALWLSRGITPASEDESSGMVTSMHWSQWLIITLCLASFTGPFFAVQAGLPAYTGLMLGLGLVWMMQEFFRKTQTKQTSLMGQKIEALIEKIDIPSLQFFIGILAAVTALHMVGSLQSMTQLLYGEGTGRTIVGHTILGLSSAIFDNVPLTAIAIQSFSGTDGTLWSLLAFTVGTGGSILVIGSAAGVVAIGILDKLREEYGHDFVAPLSFGAYAKHAALPNITGFFAGVATWWLMHS
ncbi:MAG: sodium:proton antiporter NhaD [Acidobacteria bacterium]|nr:sodium:proton antiporter NhaD [Acidobacteriota bacterium]